jgi:hypothetical protein
VGGNLARRTEIGPAGCFGAAEQDGEGILGGSGVAPLEFFA